MRATNSPRAAARPTFSACGVRPRRVVEQPEARVGGGVLRDQVSGAVVGPAVDEQEFDRFVELLGCHVREDSLELPGLVQDGDDDADYGRLRRHGGGCRSGHD